MALFDVVVLTDARYVAPKTITSYVQNVLQEDGLVVEALEKRGLKVLRTNWDNPTFDWSTTTSILFRTTWDYFDRFDEFSIWLNKVSNLTTAINPISLIRWNIDKHYLQDLEEAGIAIPPTRFIEIGDTKSLKQHFDAAGWAEAIVKPAISGAARHTYRLNKDNIHEHENVFQELIGHEAMLLQEFQHQILKRGEVAFMVFGGKFSHAILKKGKPGDFRVQDDFGGTVHDYHPTAAEIQFAEKVVNVCDPTPIYARVDVIWDNGNDPCVSELELIEPELWFRNYPPAANLMAQVITAMVKK